MPVIKDCPVGSFSVKPANESYIKSNDMRHPLGEKLLVNETYVPNDLNLNNENRGMLVYGLNSSGKSNFMKSIGCNLILAQAGMFVAAKEFEYQPFNRIITRRSTQIKG